MQCPAAARRCDGGECYNLRGEIVSPCCRVGYLCCRERLFSRCRHSPTCEFIPSAPMTKSALYSLISRFEDDAALSYYYRLDYYGTTQSIITGRDQQALVPRAERDGPSHSPSVVMLNFLHHQLDHFVTRDPISHGRCLFSRWHTVAVTVVVVI